MADPYSKTTQLAVKTAIFTLFLITMVNAQGSLDTSLCIANYADCYDNNNVWSCCQWKGSDGTTCWVWKTKCPYCCERNACQTKVFCDKSAPFWFWCILCTFLILAIVGLVVCIYCCWCRKKKEVDNLNAKI